MEAILVRFPPFRWGFPWQFLQIGPKWSDGGAFTSHPPERLVVHGGSTEILNVLSDFWLYFPFAPRQSWRGLSRRWPFFLPAKTRLDRAQDITQHNYGEGSVFAGAVLVNCSQKKSLPLLSGFFYHPFYLSPSRALEGPRTNRYLMTRESFAVNYTP